MLRRSLQARGLVDPVDTIGAATVAAAGIYGSAPTSHLGLARRLPDYTPEVLEEERLERRTILRVAGMRGSVFLAPRELVPAVLALSRPKTVRRTLAGAGIDDAELERLMRLVEAGLAGSSLTAKEIRARLGPDDPGGPLTTLVLRAMSHEGRIVAAEPVGGDYATAFRYALMAEWTPLVAPVPSKEAALAEMAPIWMRANGPGTIDDLAWWAGVTKRQARDALLSMEARPVVVEGLDGEQWATDEVIEGSGAAEVGGVVNLLPVWDAWLMARRERSRLLEPAHRPWVVDKSGNVANTITLDGRIVGTWDIEGETLLVHRFARLELDAIEGAAQRLRSVLDWTSLREVSSPSPLDDGGQNAFRGPLGTTRV